MYVIDVVTKGGNSPKSRKYDHLRRENGPHGVSRVQQNYSSLANVNSLRDKGPFFSIVDDKERAGVVVASKSKCLEAT